MAFALASSGIAAPRVSGFAAQRSLRPARFSAQRLLVVRAEKDTTSELQGIPITDKGQKSSYEKLEAPVRGGEGASGSIPDGGPPVAERNNALDNLLIQNDGAEEKSILGTAVAFPDAMRFKGALPEVVNSRLAMLGIIAALGSELATGRTVAEQVAIAPGAIAATFLLFIVASVVPVLRGAPRKGGKEWGGLPQFTADAELINGRVAMLGFVALIITDIIRTHA